MAAGYGFATGFARGMEKNFREKAAEEKDAAALAAARYEKNRQNFFEQEKEDQKKINQAEQIIEQLYPNASTRDKEARKTDAVQLLRADNSFKDVLALMEEREYEKIKDEQKDEAKAVKVETETPTDKANVGDVVSQTNEALSSADVTKALESGDDGFKKEVKDESKDAEFKTEVKDESNDVGFFQNLKNKAQERSDRRVERRLDKLTGVSKEERDKFAGGYNPTEYNSPSGTVFTLKVDPAKQPSSLGGLLTQNLLDSDEYKNANTEERRAMILQTIKDQKVRDETETMSSLIIQLQELDPNDPSFDKKKNDLLARINSYAKAEAYIEAIKDSGEAETLEMVSLDEGSLGKVTFAREVPQFDGTNMSNVYISSDNNQTELDPSKYLILTDDIRSEAQSIRKGKTDEIKKYNEKVVDTIDAVRLMGQSIDLIDQYPLMLTTFGGTVPQVLKGIGIEVLAINDTISKYADRSKNGEEFTVDLADFQSELNLPEGVTLATIEQSLDNMIGSQLIDQATAKSLYETKTLLMAFRLGGLEGQSGNALSNKDFERLQMILNPSKDTRVAKTALRDYMVSMIREQDTRAAIINDDPSVKGFENKYGINPYFLGAQPVKTIDQYAQGEYLEDAGFQNGYKYFKDYSPTGETPTETSEKTEVKTFPKPNQEEIEMLKKGVPGLSEQQVKDFFIEIYGEAEYNRVMGVK